MGIGHVRVVVLRGRAHSQMRSAVYFIPIKGASVVRSRHNRTMMPGGHFSGLPYRSLAMNHCKVIIKSPHSSSLYTVHTAFVFF